MPVQNTILQVFVASPDDVSEERALLGGVIDELNRTWADTLGISYRLYGWESCVTPGFGSEAQAVINSQIPKEYDVFIGIFWGRLGSPTRKFPSGSVEEFERAFERYGATGVPEIMIYFKDSPLQPSKMDPRQLQGLQEFKTSLDDKGGLYSTFEDQDGFEASLRSHLSAIARKYSEQPDNKKVASMSEQPGSVSAGRTTTDDIDDLGYLDYIEIYSSEAEKMTMCLDRINQLTVQMGNKLTKRTEQIGASENTPSKAKQFMLMSATDMNQYSVELDSQLDIYKSSKSKSFDALSQSVSLHNEIIGKDEDLLSLQITLKELLPSISDSRKGIVEMRDGAAGMPRMIKEVNHAKRKLIEVLDRFISEIDSTLATASNIVESIDQMV